MTITAPWRTASDVLLQWRRQDFDRGQRHGVVTMRVHGITEIKRSTSYIQQRVWRSLAVYTSRPVDNVDRFPQILNLLGFENWDSQWLSGGNLDF